MSNFKCSFIKLKLLGGFEFSSIAANEVFSTVVAIDCDEGINARVHYSIVDLTGTLYALFIVATNTLQYIDFY